MNCSEDTDKGDAGKNPEDDADNSVLPPPLSDACSSPPSATRSYSKLDAEASVTLSIRTILLALAATEESTRRTPREMHSTGVLEALTQLLHAGGLPKKSLSASCKAPRDDNDSIQTMTHYRKMRKTSQQQLEVLLVLQRSGRMLGFTRSWPREETLQAASAPLRHSSAMRSSLANSRGCAAMRGRAFEAASSASASTAGSRRGGKHATSGTPRARVRAASGSRSGRLVCPTSNLRASRYDGQDICLYRGPTSDVRLYARSTGECEQHKTA